MTTSAFESDLLPGTTVHCRGLRWDVVMTQNLGAQTLYRLRGREGAVAGKELDVLYPLEGIVPERSEIRPEKAAPLTNWLVTLQAFLLEQALGPDALLAVQPGRLLLEPYQLVPALRAIRASRVRLLLADAVGLGKTVQAGLVLTELIARRLAHRILIVSPAGPLLDQWQTEMTERFGLRLQVIDRAKLDEIRRSTELGSNPFDSISYGLTSIDFIKQESVLELLEKSSYDVIVIDEAHHCMDAGAAADREDSLRRRLAEVLSRKCDSLLLLTATPHDGNDRSFASLCELLDPSLVDGRGALRGSAYRQHVVRRLKKHVFTIDATTGEKIPKFKEREVLPVPVQPEHRYEPFVAMRSPLELKFWRLFEEHGFRPEKQVPVSVGDGGPNISIADFAVADRRVAMYVDSAAFHVGANLRRDQRIRQKLKSGTPPWNVIVLRSSDLRRGRDLVDELRQISGR